MRGRGPTPRAVTGGLTAGNFVSVRLGPRLGIDTMIRGGTVIAAGAGIVMAALAWAGARSVATVIGPMFCYAFGLSWVLPNAMAGAIGPFPRMEAGGGRCRLRPADGLGALCHCRQSHR
jgi:MFS transporter, DHA1 family, multidrug resistance protein